jgi:DNA-binding HxlR family transcriptional regulator
MAKALEIIGDRWTLLIIRDMLCGMAHFNDLERGLPGISRPLLASRLRQLQGAGLVEKRSTGDGRKTTEYHLTEAGNELIEVITPLVVWGTKWAFGDPTPEELDPVLLMWWMRNRVKVERITEPHITIQFDFHGAEIVTFWLVVRTDDVTICLTDPGYEINVLVTADLATYFKLWAGRISYDEAINLYGVTVEGVPRFVRAFPDWFAWSHATDTVRAVRPVSAVIIR